LFVGHAADATDATTRVMVEIARLLPREYRGVYADDAASPELQA
jgi:hypothetical protein